MDANLIRTEKQVFGRYEIVEKPKIDRGSKYDGIVKALANLDSDKALELPLLKNDLSFKSAKAKLHQVKAFAKKKYGYRIGGALQNESLFLWKNPN